MALVVLVLARYEAMQRCWLEDRKLRPRAAEMVDVLQNTLMEAGDIQAPATQESIYADSEQA